MKNRKLSLAAVSKDSILMFRRETLKNRVIVMKMKNKMAKYKLIKK